MEEKVTSQRIEKAGAILKGQSLWAIELTFQREMRYWEGESKRNPSDPYPQTRLLSLKKAYRIHCEKVAEYGCQLRRIFAL